MHTTRLLGRADGARPYGAGHAPSRLGALLLTTAILTAALLGAVLADATAVPAAQARAAGTVSLTDTAHLHRTSHHGFTINEEGSASGTISIHLNIVSTDRVTAEVSLYPSGSSITGYATADYRSSGAVASFSGTMTIERGSGRYRGAHGSGLSFTGNVQRSNDTVVVHVSGRMST